MAVETILQHWVLTNFAYPFLLIFFIAFAVLEKTQIFGKDKKQSNALIAFVLALIFVSAVSPKLVVGNLILFLTVSLVVVFIILLLWGFVSGGEAKIEGKGVRIAAGIAVVVAVILGVVWASGVELSVLDFLFNQAWSKAFWTNALFILVVAAALAFAIKGVKK